MFILHVKLYDVNKFEKSDHVQVICTSYQETDNCKCVLNKNDLNIIRLRKQ